MLVSQMRDKGTAVRFQSDTQHQPPAAHTFEQCVMVRDKLLQTGAEPLSHLLHMLGKVRLKDHVKHCVARRHRERIAAIGRTMRTEHHAFCGLFTCKAGPERETAANAFCDRPDVGDSAIFLIVEADARTHDPAFQFIKYESQTGTEPCRE